VDVLRHSLQVILKSTFEVRGLFVKPILFLILSTSIFSLQAPKLNWMSFYPPEYPRVAQIAHIEGKVTLKLALQAGEVVGIQEQAGHPMLVPAAIQSLKMSRLGCMDCSNEAQTFTVVFDFQVASHDCNDPEVPTRATLDSPTHVTITSQAVCTYDPIATYRKIRSIHCLYLWRCATRPE
jgi:hypothetical protein